MTAFFFFQAKFQLEIEISLGSLEHFLSSCIKIVFLRIWIKFFERDTVEWETSGIVKFILWMNNKNINEFLIWVYPHLIAAVWHTLYTHFFYKQLFISNAKLRLLKRLFTISAAMQFEK